MSFLLIVNLVPHEVASIVNNSLHSCDSCLSFCVRQRLSQFFSCSRSSIAVGATVWKYNRQRLLFQCQLLKTIKIKCPKAKILMVQCVFIVHLFCHWLLIHQESSSNKQVVRHTDPFQATLNDKNGKMPTHKIGAV